MGRSYELPMLADRLGRAIEETGLQRPDGYAECARRVRLYAAIGQTLRTLAPEVYGSRPDALAAAADDGRDLRFGERRALRRQARSLWIASGKPSREELCAALTEAAEQLTE